MTPETIDEFFDTYRGSESERDDLLALYKEHDGNMPLVFEFMMCSDDALDSHRFMDAIDAAIKQGVWCGYYFLAPCSTQQ